MIEELRRICTLQRVYTSANTPEMEERGLLIRQAVPKALQTWRAERAAALGPFGDDMGIEGSDGIGRKTEAPWVRVFSQRMSPAATEGFYVVLHFAANGSAVFVTVGFGSTEWNNGDLKAQSGEALDQRREWGWGILTSRLGTLEPFADEVELGAKADLPRTFEKATVIARRIAVEDLEVEDFRRATVEAAKRLAMMYEAQVLGSDMAEVVEREMAAATRPQRIRAGLRPHRGGAGGGRAPRDGRGSGVAGSRRVQGEGHVESQALRLRGR
ncbi:MrcB family domain-containing protein [Xanthobacter sediminis]